MTPKADAGRYLAEWVEAADFTALSARGPTGRTRASKSVNGGPTYGPTVSCTANSPAKV